MGRFKGGWDGDSRSELNGGRDTGGGWCGGFESGLVGRCAGVA